MMSKAGHARSDRPVSFAFTVMPTTGRQSVYRLRPPVQSQLAGVPEPTHAPAACCRQN